jgi:hypothetical protein
VCPFSGCTPRSRNLGSAPGVLILFVNVIPIKLTSGI